MDSIVLYASMLCPDCPPFKNELDELKVDYRFVNITESIMNLKEFLKIRDNNEEFKNIKENGSVGIPCLVVNNEEFIFDISKLEERFK